MQVKIVGSTLEITFPYNAALVERVKALPERRFEKTPSPRWLVPTRHLQTVAERFPDAEIIGEDTGAALAHIASATDAAFDVPGLGGELMPFQRAGVAFISQSDGRAIVGDEMGLGKTVQALAWLQLRPDLRPAVIVCPASLKLNWQREAAKWLTAKKAVAVLEGTRPKALPSADIYIVNYDILHAWLPLLLAAGPRVTIADEAHYAKTPSSTRSKALRHLTAKTESVLLLSGTPLMNRPAELWPLLNMVDPGGWPKFFPFAQRYCNAHQKRIGRDRMAWDFGGASHLAELAQAVRRNMVRRRKADVLTELPAKRRVVVPCSMTGAAKVAYNLALTKAKEAIRTDPKLTGYTLGEIEAAKQEAVRGKLDAAIAWVRDFIESEKLVLFATHHFVVDAIMDAFGAAAVEVTGRTEQADRQAAVDRFQSDDTCRLFVGNIQAAGVGLTLTAASNVAFLELAWTPAAHDQAEDRTHRIGQQNAVTAWYLLATDTIDEAIFGLLEGKRKIVAKVTDGTAQAELVFGDGWRESEPVDLRAEIAAAVMAAGAA